MPNTRYITEIMRKRSSRSLQYIRPRVSEWNPGRIEQPTCVPLSKTQFLRVGVCSLVLSRNLRGGTGQCDRDVTQRRVIGSPNWIICRVLMFSSYVPILTDRYSLTVSSLRRNIYWPIIISDYSWSNIFPVRESARRSRSSYSSLVGCSFLMRDILYSIIAIKSMPLLRLYIVMDTCVNLSFSSRPCYNVENSSEREGERDLLMQRLRDNIPSDDDSIVTRRNYA